MSRLLDFGYLPSLHCKHNQFDH